MLKKNSSIASRLKDQIRRVLSRHPLVYAFLGGVGIVLFWRGTWVTADFLTYSLVNMPAPFWWDGPLSILISLLILLPLGIFVSSFIGNEVIISGLRGEKKIIEKTEGEIEREMNIEDKDHHGIAEIINRLKNIEVKINK